MTARTAANGSEILKRQREIYDGLLRAIDVYADWPSDPRIFLDLRALEIELLEHFWPLPRVPIILELGAGMQIQSCLLSPHADRYLTLDLAGTHGSTAATREQLRTAAGVTNVWPIVGDAHALPLGSDSVDLIYSSNVFEHLIDPQRCVAEIARVLHVGGFCVMVVPIPWTRVNYFVEQYLWLIPRTVVRGWRLVRKRYLSPRATTPTAATPPSTRETAVRNQPLRQLLVREAIEMLRFRTHGEHYRSAWEEVLAYRIASWRRLFDGDRFDLVATFSDRLTLEWFGAGLNLALYRATAPAIKRIGNRWPFYNIGHEIVLVYKRR